MRARTNTAPSALNASAIQRASALWRRRHCADATSPRDTNRTRFRNATTPTNSFTQPMLRRFRAALQPRAFRDEAGDLCRRRPDDDPDRLERLLLGLRCARRAGDDRACVPHGLAGRRREAGDVREDRFLRLLGDPRGRLLLLVAADLAHEHDELRLRVGLELLHDVDERRADDGVAADPDDRRVPEPETRPTVPSLKISAGMIPTFAFPGLRTPGQFGPISVTPFGRVYV